MTFISEIVCVFKRQKFQDRVLRSARRKIHWRSRGHRPHQRRRIDWSVTEWRRPVQWTQSQWTIWLLDHATCSQCGLSALKDFAATTSRVLQIQVCLGLFYFCIRTVTVSCLLSPQLTKLKVQRTVIYWLTVTGIESIFLNFTYGPADATAIAELLDKELSYCRWTVRCAMFVISLERGLGQSPSRNRIWCILTLKYGIRWQQ